MRTAIGKVCKALGIPVFSPHDLRHRRASLLHSQGKTWAEVGQMLGQKDLAVTANVYTHVLMTNDAEVGYEALLADAE